MAMLLRLLFFTFCLSVVHNGGCHAFLPGLQSHAFRENETLSIGIVPLSNSVAGVPDFYDLPFCQDTTLWRVQPQYLPDVLLNTQLLPTPYDIKVLTNVSCRFLCLVPNFANQGKSSRLFTKLVTSKKRPLAKLRVDSLPVLHTKSHGETVDGFALGHHDADDFYVTNHLTFTIHFTDSVNGYGEREVRISSVQMQPRSSGIHPKNIGECESESQPQKASGDVMFTYSVYWIRSTSPWPSRWDHFLQKKELETSFWETITWILISCAPIAIIYVVCKLLARHLGSSNRTKNHLFELLKDHTHHVEHDKIDILSALVGSGVQILAASLVAALAAVHGFRDPSARGSMMQLTFCSFCGLGALNGYVSIRISSSFKSSNMLTPVLLSSVLSTTLVHGLLAFLNWTLHVGGYPHTIPLDSSASMYLLALSLCSMTVYIGTWVGSLTSQSDCHLLYLQGSMMQHEREIWGLHKLAFRFGGGLFLFGAMGSAVCLHLANLPHLLSYSSVLLAFGVVIAISGCMSTLSTYFHFTCGNGKWWWESFIVPSCSSVFVLGAGCALVTLLLRSGQGHAALMLAAYSVLVASAVALASGAVGFLSGWHLASLVASQRMKLDERCSL